MSEPPYDIGLRVGKRDFEVYGERYGTSCVSGREDDYGRGYRDGYAAAKLAHAEWHAKRKGRTHAATRSGDPK